MSNTKTIPRQSENAALQDELENRYGPAIAQGIMDQIKQADSGDSAPEYMVVKACSEMVELFRGEAQAILKQIKAQPLHWGNNCPNSTSLHKCKLEVEFKRVFRLYWASMKLFYPLYDRAMATHRTKAYRPARVSPPTETALAA